MVLLSLQVHILAEQYREQLAATEEKNVTTTKSKYGVCMCVCGLNMAMADVAVSFCGLRDDGRNVGVILKLESS